MLEVRLVDPSTMSAWDAKGWQQEQEHRAQGKRPLPCCKAKRALSASLAAGFLSQGLLASSVQHRI